MVGLGFLLGLGFREIFKLRLSAVGAKNLQQKLLSPHHVARSSPYTPIPLNPKP